MGAARPRFRNRRRNCGDEREPKLYIVAVLVECDAVNARRVTCLPVVFGLVFLYICPALAYLTKPRAYEYQGINTIRNIRIEFDLTNVLKASAAQQLPVLVSPK